MNITTTKPNDDGPIIINFETNGDSVINKIWIDCEESVWIESNDGTQICLPKEIKKFIANKIKEITYSE